MDSAHTISRRTLMSGAIAASFVAIPAKAAGVLPKLNLAEEARQDAVEAEIREIFASASPEDKQLMLTGLRWLVDGAHAETCPDPRLLEYSR